MKGRLESVAFPEKGIVHDEATGAKNVPKSNATSQSKKLKQINNQLLNLNGGSQAEWEQEWDVSFICSLNAHLEELAYVCAFEHTSSLGLL